MLFVLFRVTTEYGNVIWMRIFLLKCLTGQVDVLHLSFIHACVIFKNEYIWPPHFSV
jgi:hypothetical protein